MLDLAFNSASGLMAELGNCPSSGNFNTAVPVIWVNEVSILGSILSGSKGYTGGDVNPNAIAIDCSGNVWATNGGSVTEFMGAATPVVTPLVANLIAPYSAPASRP